MKTVATIELEPGMVTGEDAVDYNGYVVVHADKTLTSIDIKRLNRHQIMAVVIKERVDFATTHYERVRVSDEFQRFEEQYDKYFAVYKTLLMNYVLYQKPFRMEDLMKVYENIVPYAATPELLLDYLYNMTPSEDDMTHRHCLNSALIAGVFGKWLELSDTDLDILIQTGFVYDIGKLRIPDKILWKTGKLDDHERNLLRKHPKMGYDMVSRLAVNVHIPLATLQHHERNDGSGYPDNLKADAIDPFAKYIAIVDTYEAMSSPRVYRESMHPFQIIANYEQNRGYERYDAQALRTILTNLANTQMGLKVRLSGERIGEIVYINEQDLTHPTVKLLDYAKGNLMNTAQAGLEVEAIL